MICALGTVLKGLVRELKRLKSKDVRRPSKVQHYFYQPEYWKESWWVEKTCCHSDSSERRSADTGMKNSQGVICREFQSDHTNKWYMHNPAPVLKNDSHKLLWDFNIQTDRLIPARRPGLIITNKRKRICKIVDFAVPADHRINLKESEKKDKYLARELKKLWNMKVTIVPIVIGALGTVTKGLLKGLEDLEVGGRVETIQPTALLRTARILRRVLVSWDDLLSLKLQWKTIRCHWCEKL